MAAITVSTRAQIPRAANPKKLKPVQLEPISPKAAIAKYTLLIKSNRFATKQYI